MVSFLHELDNVKKYQQLNFWMSLINMLCTIFVTCIIIGILFSFVHADNYSLPVPGHTTLSAGFYTPRPYGLHMALDIPCERYATVCATISGNVIATDYNQTLGNFIVIKSKDGHTHLYAHLQRIYKVWPGDTVKRGQKIGEAGDSGDARGVHLHYAEFNLKGIQIQTTFKFGIMWKLLGNIYKMQDGQT